MTAVAIRLGTADDVARASLVLAQAFAHDPVWGWAYPTAVTEPEGVAAIWELWVRSAVAQRSLWVTEHCEAVSVWVPPGASEMSEADAALFEPRTRELIGPRTADVLAAMDDFEAAHPHAPEHHYLSLLGTADASRGHGIGMALMSAVLERIDAEGMPAYLESTNPAANDARYAAVGFEPHGSFTIAASGAPVTTMWRAA